MKLTQEMSLTSFVKQTVGNYYFQILATETTGQAGLKHSAYTKSAQQRYTASGRKSLISNFSCEKGCSDQYFKQEGILKKGLEKLNRLRGKEDWCVEGQQGNKTVEDG